MADIIDILRALNAPPALGDYSAAKAQPYLNTGIGTGGGMQLVMKDPQGVGSAADQWARARMATADPFANLIWGDTVGGAQNSLLNERARQVQVAMAREQMARDQERQNRIERASMAEQETRRQIGRQNFLANLARSASTANTRNASAIENLARLRQLGEVGGGLMQERGDIEADLLSLRDFLSQNAERAVAGNPDLAVREGASGLPEFYSPTNRADANVLRNAEAATFRDLPYGVEGPSLANPRRDYEDLASQLGELDTGYRQWQRDYSSASRRPTSMVDTSIFEQLLGGGDGSPRTVGQSAVQLLQNALARGAAYRLPQGTVPARDLGPIRRSAYRQGDPPTPGLRAGVESPRWTFDPETLRFV